MKKLLIIIVLSLLWNGNSYAEDDIILIQCQNDNPDLALFRPLYEINLKTKKVKVGASEYYVVGYDTNEILIRKATSVLDIKITFNRNTGRYEQISTTVGKERKEIVEKGICVKRKKAF